MVNAINWSVATSADLTTAANGKRSWQDSVGSGARESSDLTCWESLHSTGTGTLSPRMSLTKETFEANGKYDKSWEEQSTELSLPTGSSCLATGGHSPRATGGRTSTGGGIKSRSWRTLANLSLGVRRTKKPGGVPVACLSVDGIVENCRRLPSKSSGERSGNWGTPANGVP